MAHSNLQDRHLTNIEQRILPAVTVLPYDTGTAKIFGKIRAHLEEAGTILPDLQIAATALSHDIELVTGNLRYFNRIFGSETWVFVDNSGMILTLYRQSPTISI